MLIILAASFASFIAGYTAASWHRRLKHKAAVQEIHDMIGEQTVAMRNACKRMQEIVERSNKPIT